MSQRKFAEDRDLSAVTFVVLDLETSGSSAQSGSAITEIGAVKVRGGVVIATFETFINPGRPIPYFITELTGITDQMLANAPSIGTILPLLLEFMGNPNETVFVAHNAPFDISFLRAAANLNGYLWPDFRVIDTVKVARVVLSKDDVANYRLGTLAQYFHTTVTPNHRALDDALATMDVLHGVIERMGTFGIFSINKMLVAGRKKSATKAKKPLIVRQVIERDRPTL